MSKTQDNGDIILTAIGNPVVDTEVMVPDRQFFVRHNLPLDGQRPESAEFLATLEEDFKRRNYRTMVFPGGCAQNTLRVFQWLMNSRLQSCMIGAIGDDVEGAFLIDRLGEDGVKPCFVVVNNCPTCSLFVFVHGNSRFIVYPTAEKSAAGQYSLERFLGHEDALRSLENSCVVFIEGFFAEHSPKVALKLLDMCIDAGIVTSYNICSTAVVEQNFAQSTEPYLQKCTIIVGNVDEFKCVCAKLNVSTEDTRQAVIDLHKWMMSYHLPTAEYRLKSLERYKKILVVTNGDKEVYCVTESDGLIDYVPPSIEHVKIKDTTGAGDSFIAGFLYALVKEQPITRCLDIACRVAAQLIQCYGVVIPKEKANFLEDHS